MQRTPAESLHTYASCRRSSAARTVARRRAHRQPHAPLCSPTYRSNRTSARNCSWRSPTSTTINAGPRCGRSSTISAPHYIIRTRPGDPPPHTVTRVATSRVLCFAGARKGYVGHAHEEQLLESHVRRGTQHGGLGDGAPPLHPRHRVAARQRHRLRPPSHTRTAPSERHRARRAVGDTLGTCPTAAPWRLRRVDTPRLGLRTLLVSRPRCVGTPRGRWR